MRPVHVLCLAASLAVWVVPAAAQAPDAQPTPAAAPQATAAPAPAPAPVTVPTVYHDKLKVEVDGKAEVNGAIQLQFQASGREPVLVNVNVLAKMKDKDIANDLWKELSLAGGSSFKVKLNGRRIEIKKSSSKGPKFALTIIGQSVAGVSVSTKR
jgi:hypothetical protein